MEAGGMMPGIKDIARSCGVSASTKPLIVAARGYVDAVACGKGRECRVGAAERRCHYADGEEHHNACAKTTCGGEHGQQFVAVCGQAYTPACSKLHEQYAQGEEQEVGREERETIGAHVFLCFPQCLASQVLLHHVLVESRHNDHNERSTDELFPEVLW